MNSNICKDLETASLATLTAFLGLLLLASRVEADTLVGPTGGNGGNPVREDCAPGSYVVGFKARAGDWMDQISIVCGRWDEKTQTLQPAAQGEVKGPFGDSPGGEALAESCPDGWAVSGYDYRVTRDVLSPLEAGAVTPKRYKTKFIHAIRFHCRPAIAGSGQSVHRTIGSWSMGEVSPFYGPGPCPPRELATGMHGRAGLFVDAFGLVCGLRPEPVAVGVETKPPDSSVVVAPGPLEGTKLKKGGIFDSGNVIPKEPIGKKEPTPPFPPPAGGQTATVITDVDVYDAPGGGGKKGVLLSNNKTTKVSLLAPCQDNWWHVKGSAVPTGEGWVYSGTAPDDFKSLDRELCQ